MRSTALTLRIMALAAAFMLALSGVSALASTRGATGQDGSRRTVSGSLEKGAMSAKCKKKNKKQCKKNKASAPVEEPAEEGFVPGRVVELRYEGPAIGGADTPAINLFGALFPINFIPGAGEELAMVEIVDDLSPNSSAGFSYDSDGDGLNDTGFDVCGSTAEPIAVIPGTQYNIFPYLLPSTTCTDGVATSGTIVVTFNQI